MVKIVWGFRGGLIGTESYSYLAFFRPSAIANFQNKSAIERRPPLGGHLRSANIFFFLSAGKTGNYLRLKKFSDNKTEIIIYEIIIFHMR